MTTSFGVKPCDVKRERSRHNVVGLMMMSLMASALAALSAACSDGSTRTPFTTTSEPSTGATPTEPGSEPPSSTETTTSSTQPPPATTATTTAATDAGPPPPTCKKAAPSNVCGVAPQCGCAPTETCDVADS